MVITLTNLPAEIEEALQRKAAEEGKSVDRVTVDILALGLGVTPKASNGSTTVDSVNESSTSGSTHYDAIDTSKTTYTTNEYGAILVRPATTDAAGNPLPKKRDLSDLAGTWVEDPEFDAALEDQRRIDWELWQ
jgi:plasmid stability protein